MPKAPRQNNPFKNRIPGVLPNYRISQFLGLNTETKDLKAQIPGQTPDSLNWITSTEGDSISLRRGKAILGSTDGGPGQTTGLGVGRTVGGTEVPYFTYGKKAFYYDSTSDDRVEIGSDLLGDDGNGQEIFLSAYTNLAGAWMYLSSKYTSVFKMPVANPGSYVDQGVTTYRGYYTFNQNRSFMWQRYYQSNGNQDSTNLYLSYIDKLSLADYTQVTGESVGSSGSTTYSHTAAERTGTRTIFQIVVSATVAAGTETFTDDKNGNLASNFGGTGTVNYATGAIDVTFSDVTTGAVTCSYYWEDATDEGVLDFDYNASSRTAGTGNLIPQFDGGGTLRSVFPFSNSFYCAHDKKFWQTTIASDDTSATNLTYRDNLGIPYEFSMYGGIEGVYFLNNANPSRPEVYTLQLTTSAAAATVTLPVLLTKVLDLSPYDFTYCVVREWGIYVLVSFAQVRNGVPDTFNSRTLVYNKKNGLWDMTDYGATRFAEYNGTLLSGDPLQNNVYTLFSGFDDAGFTIENYWTSGDLDLGWEGQKRVNYLTVDGLIQHSQNVDIFASFDDGGWVKLGTIEGTGSYVNALQSIAVGSYTLGSKVVGGGQTVYASPFWTQIPIHTDRFQYIRLKLQATSGGYVQFNYLEFTDVRQKTSSRVSPSRTY